MMIGRDLILESAPNVAAVVADASTDAVHRADDLATWATAEAATRFALDATPNVDRSAYVWHRRGAAVSAARAAPILEGIKDALLGVRMAREAVPERPTDHRLAYFGGEAAELFHFDGLASRAENTLFDLQTTLQRTSTHGMSVSRSDMRRKQSDAVDAVMSLHEFTARQVQTRELDGIAGGVGPIVRAVRDELDQLGLSEPLPRQVEVDRAADRVLEIGGRIT